MKCRRILALLLALMLLVSCSSGGKDQTGGAGQADNTTQTDSGSTPPPGNSGASPSNGIQGTTFAEAHDAFQTTLTRQDSDNDPIPAPPEGVFDLVSYPSKVGDLAAYVSSDPGDGEKHPLIIWVVGGWGNGIDDFPWTYPAWDDDQTGSAFWRAGVLTMYPSFRGGVGNPGYYEALFGEVDDIISAYEYAASLPYVDPDRIYLGGHSTGGTRALLASEYADCFRAVFCFGAVDEVKYHNNNWFTFDTNNEDEFTMRSPIHWLDDVKRPTFLIEGSEGNADNLRRMEAATDNENIHCYVIDGADHWGVLGPITPLLAEKILADTGASCNIELTQAELELAMFKDPTIPDPVMTQYTADEVGMTFSYPFLWGCHDESEGGPLSLALYSPYEGDNVWDMLTVYVDLFPVEEPGFMEDMADYLESEGYEVQPATVGGLPAYSAFAPWQSSSGSWYNNLYVMVERGDTLVQFDFYIHQGYGTDADGLIQSIIDSIQFS